MILFPQVPQSRKQYLQFGLVLLCLVCILPTRLFWKSRKWRFPSLVLGSDPLVNNNNHHKDSPINTTAECDYFPEALFQFTNALHDRAEVTALRDWSLSHNNNKGHVKYPAWQFPGLSGPLLDQTLRGKTIVLLGDSTLFYMMRWIQTLLLNTTQATLDHLLHMDMTAGNHAVNPNAEDQVGWEDETDSEIQLEDGTHIVWTGHRGDPGEEACHFDAIWARIRQLQPDILIVNFGLHWLHLIADQDRGRSVPLCAVQYWLHYEQDWLHQVTQVAMKSHVKLLLFKTTNYMCIDNFGGDYSDAVALYQRQDAYALNRCERELQRKRDYYHNPSLEMASSVEEGLEDANLTRYCAKGVLDEYGAKDLNHRVLEFVHEYNTKKNHPPKSSGRDLQMAIFNDHDTQSCPYSEPNDGRHYHPLNLMRIRLLANMIQCLYPAS